ncbi:aspartate aminotransferase family protein [Salinadaptatus halalkaliphilus]|nr:aspartate aminotransferase family protein [Salinadaptatus halalkaliphilus]
MTDDTDGRSHVERYRDRTETSRRHHETALEYLPGGNTREALHYSPYPAYLEDGDGAVVTDVDGNEYLDFLNNYTSLIHGHAPTGIVEAATDAVRRGSAPGGPTTDEIELARHLVDRAPALELIRFTNSGTEATMNAIRAARAYTGNDIVAKFEGAYHGTHDDAQVSIHPPAHLSGPADDPTSVPDSAGVPDSKREEVLSLPFNDADATVEKLERHRDELACVLLAPYMGSAVVPPEPDFLETLADWTDRTDVPLIFDEVISLRVAYGGAHATLDVEPDLITYGKIVGGGFPVGAFGGREELLDPYDPRGGASVVHSGTFNANPVTASAGLAALEAFDEAAVERLDGLADTLASASRDVIADRGLSIQFNRAGSLFTLYLSPDPVRTYRDKPHRKALERRLFHELQSEGVRLAPKLMGCLSTPMDEAEVDQFVAALDTALGRLAPTIAARAPEMVD